jgi:hypothetical protein
MGVKKAEFYADFKYVEKVVAKIPQKFVSM